MVTLRIEHPLSDFGAWCEAFLRFADARERAGVRRQSVRRPVDDDHRIVVELGFDDVDAARSFEAFLRETVWARPENSPGLAGDPVTVVLGEDETPG